ncbi:4Fe-4S binding protein [Larkinella rosea]|uniref:4Fe-4S dicluster domain-containing protein n=1 Tax=Larkinella rosea TaxID=2025312 RepID=A0A3P1BUU0_9BACT|nr:4Fe-4S binding protein [Larkinella rosea]RRB04633.1 4Fe-4S dicluster domain-containing protein [Larkinella rosea]
MSPYFKDIQEGIQTTLTGLKLTFRHLLAARQSRKPINVQQTDYFGQDGGIVTLQYPFETIPVPDNGRYRLHNEMDDCIVCDKCVKVCPVDCITIDAIKATEEVGKASDGSPIRLYAGKFDIDMAKCCYCGLCTTVCPTECLTMTKTYDFSEFELGNMTYHYANLTPEQADEKRSLYEQFVREKEEIKAQQAADKAATASPSTQEAPKKPVFRPGIKPAPKPAESEPAATPVAQQPAAEPVETAPAAEIPAPKPRPVFRPTLKTPASQPPNEAQKPLTEQNSAGSAAEHPLTDVTPDEAERIAMEGLEKPAAPTPAPRPAFRPTLKPKPAPVTEDAKPGEIAAEKSAEEPKPVATKPAFRPTLKPKTAPPAEESKPVEPAASGQPIEEEPKPVVAKPVFRPTLKPKTAPPIEDVKPAEAAAEKPVEEIKPVVAKPAFRPTMRPKTVPSPPVEEPKPLEPIAEIPTIPEPVEPPVDEQKPGEPAKPRPAFRPTMKPKQPPKDES